jgi:hypothetical protein
MGLLTRGMIVETPRNAETSRPVEQKRLLHMLFFRQKKSFHHHSAPARYDSRFARYAPTMSDGTDRVALAPNR